MRNSIIGLLLLASTSIFAQKCESVDQMIAKFKVGVVDQLALNEAVDCNLEIATTSREFCNTKKGLKQDQLKIKSRMFDVGLITSEELELAKQDLLDASRKCN